MRINFQSENKEQAARIANAMIDGYIFDQLNAKYQANRRAVMSIVDLTQPWGDRIPTWPQFASVEVTDINTHHFLLGLTVRF